MDQDNDNKSNPAPSTDDDKYADVMLRTRNLDQSLVPMATETIGALVSAAKANDVPPELLIVSYASLLLTALDGHKPMDLTMSVLASMLIDRVSGATPTELHPVKVRGTGDTQ